MYSEGRFPSLEPAEPTQESAPSFPEEFFSPFYSGWNTYLQKKASLPRKARTPQRRIFSPAVENPSETEGASPREKLRGRREELKIVEMNSYGGEDSIREPSSKLRTRPKGLVELKMDLRMKTSPPESFFC